MSTSTHSDKVGSARPVLIKKNLTGFVRKETGAVAKCKYSLGRDIFLNHSALFVFDSIQKKKSVDEIISDLHLEYPEVYKDKIAEDVIKTLNKLWKFALITWADGVNPFENELVIRSDKDYSVLKVSHDHEKGIKRLLRKEVFLTPYMQVGSLKADPIVYGSLMNTIDGLIYKTKDDIDCVVVLSKQQRTRDLMAIYGDSTDSNSLNKYRTILDEVQKAEGCRFITAPVSTNNVHGIELCEKLGFNKVGTLKKEIKDGDIYLFLRDMK